MSKKTETELEKNGMRRLFGTDGIRGKANVYPMDADTAFKVGVVSAHLSKDRTSAPVIIIGRDTRLSGSMLEGALAAGICAAGGEALIVGEIPTPGVAFLTRSTDAEAGIVISASHNPFVDNGIKLFNKSGFKLPDELELKIEEHMLDGDIRDYFVDPHEVGRVRYWPEGADLYKTNLGGVLEGRSLDGLKIAIDCANGAAWRIAPGLFSSLGAQVTAIGIEPDGRNINKGCGSLHIEGLSKIVAGNGLDLGVAFDGDADRCVFVDETGAIVSSDMITALLARWLLPTHPKSSVVYDLRSSRVVAEEIRRAGGIPVRERVGHSFIKATMRQRNAYFGGELSGHFYWRDNYFADSGVITMIMLLNMLSAEHRPFSDLLKPLHRYSSTGEVNFEVSDKEAKLAELAAAFKDGRADKIDGLTVEYDDWWFNVRPSNTEPFLRLTLEASAPELMEAKKKQVVDILSA